MLIILVEVGTVTAVNANDEYISLYFRDFLLSYFLLHSLILMMVVMMMIDCIERVHELLLRRETTTPD